MTSIKKLSVAIALLLGPSLHSQVTEATVIDQLKHLRGFSADQRPAATMKVALDIRTLTAGPQKVRLAGSLASLATEGDAGHATLQAVADTLSQALEQSPVESQDNQPPAPYMELANLVRYEDVTTQLKSPQLTAAAKSVAAEEADVAKADFTLTDLHGKSWTLSQLRGKIVLVNFWATWCPPCRLDMPDLDALYTQYQAQGLVILSLSSEDTAKVRSLIVRLQYHPPVLIDTDGHVASRFHVSGIPKSFVFDRKGKLVAESIDMRTRRQFLVLLGKAGLQP